MKLKTGILMVLAVACVHAEKIPPSSLASSGQYSDLGIAFEQAQHQVQQQGTSLVFQNPEHDLQVEFRDGAMLTKHRGTELGMRLEAYGYGDRTVYAYPATVHTTGTKVELRRGPLTEWYVNERRGLEQGFTLRERPENGVGPLFIDLALSGDMHPVQAGEGVEFCSGAVRLQYSGLRAWDARGNVLPSRMALHNGRLRLIVDERDAVYPITVDPWIQQQRLTQLDAAADDFFGITVAVSGDTALIGASGKSNRQGAAYVFVRSGSTWTQQQKLTATAAASGDYFGGSISLDGDTAVIGAVGKDLSKGAAYVFVRAGSTWFQQQRLVASDSAAKDNFGFSASVSGDTIVVGAPGKGQTTTVLPKGQLYVYTRSGSVWTEQQRLTAADGVAGDQLGTSVAVNGDNLIASAMLNAGRGAVYAFTRNGTVWTQQQKLTASNGTDGDQFGQSLALNGDTAMIASTIKNNHQGMVYVFTRTGSVWTEQQRLVAGDPANGDNFGSSVSISGSLAVVGAPQKNDISTLGAAYVFIRSGATWAQQQKLTVNEGISGFSFGVGVAIDNGTVVVGAYGYLAYRGAAYVFTGNLAPTVSFTGAPATAEYGTSFTVSATSNSTSTPIISATGACSISGTLVTMISGVGNCQLTANWPADATYLAASATQTTVARKATPTLTWQTPFPLTYGFPLGPQLNATASVAGTFVYSPMAGTILAAGNNQTLTANFTPSASDNYATATISVQIDVLKQTVPLTLNSLTPIYDGTPKAVTATYPIGPATPIPPGLTINITYDGLASPPIDAGSYAIVATLNDPNYQGSATGTLTIIKAVVGVSPAAASKVFGSPDPPLTGLLNGFVASDGVTAVYSRTPGESVTLTPYVISATLSPQTALRNYAISYNTAPFTITKAPSTVVVSCPVSVTYNGQPQTPCTATVTGAGGLNQSVTPLYDATVSHINVGTVRVLAVFAGDANHTSSGGVKSFSILPAPVTATAGSYNGNYDGATHTPSACVVSGTFIGTLTCSNSPSSVGPNAGSGAIQPTVNGDVSNFIVTSANGSWNITAAMVTAAAGSYAGTYDGASHTPTACIVSGNFAGTLTCSNSPASVGPGAGAGTITPTLASDPNIVVTSVNGTWSIDRASSTVTVVCPPRVTYNGATQTPCTATVTGAGGLSQTLTLTYADNANVGTSRASAAFAGDANHTPSSGSASFLIDPAPVTATAGSYSGTYDGVTHSGTPCVVSGPFTGRLTCSNSPSSVGPNAGSGSIQPTVNGDASNFTVTSVNGSWNIAAVAVTATAGSYSGTYDGVAHSPSACVVSGGFTGTLTCSNSPSSVGPNAGSGSIQPTVNGDASNFTVTSVNGSWNISAARVTATAGSYSGTYDGATHSPSACLVSGSFTGTLTCANTPASVGPGAGAGIITPALVGGPNFVVTSVNGSWSIDRAPSTVTVVCPSRVTYNGAPQMPCTATATGVGGLSQALTPTYSDNTNVGTGRAIAAFTGDTNHTGNSGSASFLIDPAPAVTVLSDLFQLFDGTPKFATAAVTPGYCGPALVSNDGAQSAINVGSYPVSATTSNPNCSAARATGTLIVYGLPAGGGAFVVGDSSSASPTPQTWWGSQWAKSNTLSGGSAPASFKGFAAQSSGPAFSCGGSWTTGTGNSPAPPNSVPAYMAVVVSSSVRQFGSTVTGDIQQIVVMKTDAGYASDPGHAGTGTIVGQICRR